MIDKKINAVLKLSDGTTIPGFFFGKNKSVSGEVVFNTGLVGYPETFTDPSYKGQILVLTYPLIGNYGVPKNPIDELNKLFESSKIQISGLVISDLSSDFSHWNAAHSLHDWLEENGIPAIYDVDTRALTKKLREKGTMLGKLIANGSEVEQYDPDKENQVAKVSTDEVKIYGEGKKVVLVDCGCKNNIINSLVSRGVQVVRVPWDYDFTSIDYDGLFISNGPGDPKHCGKTIENLKKAFDKKKPIFGICLGNQLLALAAGADTYKLKYGHRSQNQPCLEVGTKRCYITSQNHGFAIKEDSIPSGWNPWFTNANDGTNEGMKHESLPFMSVQFHPEAKPGPTDTAWLFDEFVGMVK